MKPQDGPLLPTVLQHPPSRLLGRLVPAWRALRPHLERLVRDYEHEWRMVAVHFEKNPELVEAWSIRATPTLIYLRYEEGRHRTAGSVTPLVVEEALNSVV